MIKKTNMAFDEFYEKYSTIQSKISKKTYDAIFFMEELYDLCAKYPEYSEKLKVHRTESSHEQ